MNASHPCSAKFSKQKAGRARRNERERNRMNNFNDALDILRKHIPINTEVQKELSRIETLRLAINYIEALQNMLQTNVQPTPLQFANTLAKGILPTNPEVLVEILQVQPHLLNLQGQFEAFSIPYTSSQNALHPHHSPQQHSIAYDPAPTPSNPPPQNLCTPNQPHSASSEATNDEMLEVQPHLLDPQEEFDSSSVSISQNALHYHHHKQPQSASHDKALTSSRSPPPHSYAPNQPHAVFRKAENERVRAQTSNMNNALDTLREHIPINNVEQKKLSKIETLRMATNYIEALRKMLQTNKVPTPLEYTNTLANGMSLKTTKALSEILQVQPHLLDRRQQFDASSIPCTSSQNALHYHNHSQQQSASSDQAPTSSRSAP